MKKRLLLAAALFAALGTQGSWAQTSTTEEDVTSTYATNADFASGLTGWTVVNGKGSAGYEKDWGTVAGPLTNGDITISAGLEKWCSEGSGLGNSSVSQTVTVSKGIYRVEADIVAVQQKDATQTNTGALLFANSSETSCTTGNSLPVHYSVQTAVTDGTLQFGFKTENTTCNWVAIDNFKIYYLGTDGLLDELKTELSAKATAAKDQLTAKANSTLINNLQTAITTAESQATAEDATEETITAASTAIDEALEAIEANEYAYTFLEEIEDDANSMSTDWKTFNSETDAATLKVLTDLVANADGQSNNLSATISGRTLDTEAVNTLLTNLKAAMKNVRGIGKEISLSSVSGFARGEKFQSKYDLYGSFTDLDNGFYVFDVQAFQRQGANATAYAAHTGGTEDISAYIYVNNGTEATKQLHSLYDYSMKEAAVSGNDYNPVEGHYYPNNMDGVDIAFGTHDLYHSYMIVEVTNNTLTVGIRCQDDNATADNSAYWSMYNNFSLRYLGAETATLMANLESYITTATARMTNANETLAATLKTAIDAAQTVVDKGTSATVTEIEEASAAIDAALEAIDANEFAYSFLEELQTDAEELSKWTTYNSTDAATVKALADIVANADGKSNDLATTITKHTLSTEDVYTFITTLKTAMKAVRGIGVDYTSLLTGLSGGEKYHVVLAEKQELTGLANGFYLFDVQAFQRISDNATTYAAHVAGTETITAYVYATTTETVEKELHSIYDYSKNVESSESNANLKDYQPESGRYYPNGPTGSLHAFNDFDLFHNYVIAEVTDGTLTVGIKSDATDAWSYYSNFTLRYLGSDDTSVLKETLTAAVTSAKSHRTDEASAELKATLETAILAAETILSNELATADELNNAITALENAQAAVIANADAYVELITAKTKADEALTSGAEAFLDHTTLDGYNTQAETAINQYNLGTEEVNTLTTNLKAATLAYYESGLTAGYDATSLITNASFDDNATTGWTGADNVTCQYTVAEGYGKTFDINQTLSDIQNGVYAVEVQGFQRNGGTDAIYTAHNNGTEEITAFFYANDNQIALHSIIDENVSSTSVGSYTDGLQTEGHQYVNNRQAVNYAFDTEELYKNTMFVKVTDGTLKIGIKCESAESNGWVCFDNFTLHYLGTSVEIPESGAATFYSNMPNDFTGSGVTAYTAALNSNNTYVELTEKTEAVAANEPVIIKGTAGTYNIPAASEAGTATTSPLVGTMAAISDVQGAPTSGTAYVLYNGTKGLGFYKAGANVTLAASHAYLVIPAETAAKSSFLPIDGQTTGIDSIEGAAEDGSVYYTIGGVRTTKPQKGLYIKNGKKVVVK